MTNLNLLTAKHFAFAIILATGGSLHAAEDDIEREFDVAPGGKLMIDSDAGAIDVNTWDQNNVRVRVRNAGNFDVVMEQRGNDVEVVAERERRSLFGIGRSSISFVVNVPTSYDLDLDTGGGHIEVSDISGEIVVDTSGGHIEIGKVMPGSVNADTSGGRITIDDVDGDVVADTSGGRITIGNVSGEVSADTSGGRIEIGDVGGNMVADTSGGSIEVGRGNGEVRLDTSGGSIRAGWAVGPIVADTSGGNIYLAGGDSDVSADTSGGNIEIAGGAGNVVADTSGGNISISGTTGPVNADTSGGRIEVDLTSIESGQVGGRVHLETAGGDVTLRLPSNISASISADLEVSRRARGDYRIYTDFPLTIREEDGNIRGEGDLNGGGDRITIETHNSDINIYSVPN